MPSTTTTFLAASCLVAAALSADAPTCSKFSAIYADGTELCEKMWGGAFEVVDDDKGYTMWFFDHVNPNDAMAATLGKPKAEQCHLEYFHKSGAPGPESDGMQECHPWKDNACCKTEVVSSVKKINENYGAGYHWDRCGTLTPACERFFVQEACFYECDPNAGLYRKYNDSVYNASDASHNKWQMHHMPIKRSFCNAWHRACFNDLFCGTGDFFSCAAQYETADALAAKQLAQLAADNKVKLAEEIAAKEALRDELGKKVKSSVKEVPTLSTGGLVAIVISALVGLAALSVVGLLISREKQGAPMFNGGLLHPKNDDHL